MCARMEKNGEISYAVIRTGGKQYRVSAGERIAVEKLVGEVGSAVLFSDVLLMKDGDTVKVGRPLIEGAEVKGKIVAHERAKKVVIYKKRRRKGYTKKQGHRQEQTRVLIESIG